MQGKKIYSQYNTLNNYINLPINEVEDALEHFSKRNQPTSKNI